MSVLVVGSVALDTIETPFGKIDDAIGGSAIYSTSAASYFAPVNLVGVIGKDFPLQSIDFLKERQVDIRGLQIQDGKTFRWSGKYHYDLNERETLFTHLNVFETFNPVIPDDYRNTEYVFLGNIDPILQKYVLQQVKSPRMVICDTMNYWIENTWDTLQEILRMVDVLMINDSETRQLSDEYNLIRAAHVIRSMGPQTLVIKKGEHGALMITEDTYFSVPAYPLESVHDPTGAGDSFAGGFVGYIAKNRNLTAETIRKAMVCGSVMASFCVEEFSIEKLISLKKQEIIKRYESFHEITAFGKMDE